ncbi:MAG TPA: ABC transporter permease subunit [Candidatus Dormibacteraeota bacterium]|nr:ABC transporter permease subunit [Candidatus Dormibacteraeota bacterium]
MLRVVVWNELEKLVRRRWLLIVLVTAAVVGLGIAIELAAPQPADWKTDTRQQIAQLRVVKDELQSAPAGVPAGFQASISSAIDKQIAAEQYLVDHDVPPSDWYPAGRAIGTILKTGFGFLLLLFGWLAAESVAQERAERTLGLLLSRPVSRRTVLIGKAAALQIVATGVLLAAMLPVYLITGLQHGGWAALTTRVMVLDDPVKGVLAGNIELLPTWFYFLVALVLSLAAVLVAQALGLLISILSRGPGLAIGATLGALLVLQPLAAVMKLSLKDPAWLHYTFWPYLTPTTELTSQPTIGLGYSSAGLSLTLLLVWAAALLVAAVILFTRRSETS